MKLAPIVLFVYNRPVHTYRTVVALLKNELAQESDLFIYSDAPKSADDVDQVSKVREYILRIHGFRSVTIVERKKNFGLANSIIEGVTEICGRYGRVIVLEDDIVTSPYFLTFMNRALNEYQDNSLVWHISGWNYPISTVGLGDTFFWRVMNCWGWATWANCWSKFNKEPRRLIFEWSKDDVRDFNMNGAHNFWGQVVANHIGKLNTWAVFWYAVIFQNKGLCLSPSISFVDNIGFDGSGENCEKTANSYVPLNKNRNITFENDVLENKIAVERLQRYFLRKKKTIIKRIIDKLMRQILKKIK
jgi:hypothetical protein